MFLGKGCGRDVIPANGTIATEQGSSRHHSATKQSVLQKNNHELRYAKGRADTRTTFQRKEKLFGQSRSKTTTGLAGIKVCGTAPPFS